MCQKTGANRIHYEAIDCTTDAAAGRERAVCHGHHPWQKYHCIQTKKNYQPFATTQSAKAICRTCLSDTALEIIERYKGQPNGRLLPFTNAADYNLAIHDMLRLAGLSRIVMVQDPKTLQTVPKQLWQVASSRLARRTFMANVFKQTKSERITSSFTGHVSGSRAFSRYTSVDDEMKLEVLKNMNERK